MKGSTVDHYGASLAGTTIGRQLDDGVGHWNVRPEWIPSLQPAGAATAREGATTLPPGGPEGDARSGRPRVQKPRTGAPDADRWPSGSSPRPTRTRPRGTSDRPSGTVIGGCPHCLSAVWQRGSHHRDARVPTGTADPQSRIGTVTATTTTVCWCRRARTPAWLWRLARSRWRGRGGRKRNVDDVGTAVVAGTALNGAALDYPCWISTR